MDHVVPDSETEAVPGVHLEQLAAGEEMSIQHLRMEPDAEIEEHSHPHEQLGFVYQGEQTFLIEGEPITVGPGETYVLYGDEPHAVENRGDEELLAVDIFSPPRPNPDWED